MVGRKEHLSDVLSEFARTLVTDFPIQSILDHLVMRIVDVMPITAAGVTLISPNTEPRYVAASNEAALRYEELQTELGEGPCVAAYHTGEAVVVADLRQEMRFPDFGPRALAEGLVAVFTFPLRNREEQLGALDLYRDSPGPLDPEAMVAAQTLADVASAYLINAQARSDLQDSSDQFRRSSLHDSLTGLPNRVLLRERLDHAILRTRRSHQSVAILFADLDRFKRVNDIHGHQIGDELLVAVAQRLGRLVRSGDTLARWSGDEFVMLCEELNDTSHVQALAQRIANALAGPFLLSTVELRAQVVLEDLKELGVMVALDDFGTAYSSLSYLQRFPIDVVKIDRSYIADLGPDAKSSPIVVAIVDLAHALGMSVIAEGVETADQHRAVRTVGCDFSQGFYFAIPMPADDLNAHMTARARDGTVLLP